MKRTIASAVVVLAVLMLAIPGCKGRENAGAGGESTETIAPATPQPEATGTEAMTQTVDVGTVILTRLHAGAKFSEKS